MGRGAGPVVPSSAAAWEATAEVPAKAPGARGSATRSDAALSAGHAAAARRLPEASAETYTAHADAGAAVQSNGVYLTRVASVAAAQRRGASDKRYSLGITSALGAHGGSEMQIAKAIAAAACLVTSSLAISGQSLVTFEEVPRHPSNFAVRVDSSGPLTFSSPLCDPICGPAGIPVQDASTLYANFDLSASGPMAGIVSDGLSFWASDGNLFSLHSAYLGMSHPFDSPEIAVTGYARGGAVYLQDLHLGQSAEMITFDWSNLEAIRFSVQIQAGHVVIDDILVSVVPEPSTAVLLLFGVACVAGFRHRQSDA